MVAITLNGDQKASDIIAAFRQEPELWEGLERAANSLGGSTDLNILVAVKAVLEDMNKPLKLSSNLVDPSLLDDPRIRREVENEQQRFDTHPREYDLNELSLFVNLKLDKMATENPRITSMHSR